MRARQETTGVLAKQNEEISCKKTDNEERKTARLNKAFSAVIQQANDSQE